MPSDQIALVTYVDELGAGVVCNPHPRKKVVDCSPRLFIKAPVMGIVPFLCVLLSCDSLAGGTSGLVERGPVGLLHKRNALYRVRGPKRGQ